MTASAPDVWHKLAAIQEKVRDVEKLLVEFRSMVAAQPDMTKTTTDRACPDCKLPFPSRAKLADHLHVTHDWSDERIETAVYATGGRSAPADPADPKGAA